MREMDVDKQDTEQEECEESESDSGEEECEEERECEVSEGVCGMEEDELGELVDAIVERVWEEHREEFEIMEENGELDESIDMDKILEEYEDGVEEDDSEGGC